MRRRQVVALVGASALPFAGCLDRVGSSATDTQATTSEPPGSSSPTETPSPTASTSTGRTLPVGETDESSNGKTVTVQGVHVRKLIRSTSVGSPTHLDVACLEDHQFAVADTEATDADGSSILTDLRFALEVDGVQYPRADQHWYWAFPPGSYDRPRLPAFPVSLSDATNAAIVWCRVSEPSVRWKLSPESVESLGQAPSFTVRSFDTPDSVRRGGDFEATFTIANTGGRDGRFITEFGAGPISDHDEVTLRVPEGTERTHTGTVDPYYPENSEELGVTLDWGCNRLHRTVTVND